MPDLSKDKPIYNSRITKNYLQYLEHYFPSIDIEPLLKYAGMTRYEVEDPSHWFTQQQVDRFHEIVVQESGRPDISLNVGRYIGSNKGMGILKQYTIGFVGPAFVYLAAGKVAEKFSRGSRNTAVKLGPNKIETRFIPLPGVQEKSYQCQNRIGALEALAKVFTGKFALVDHPECYHRGAPCCRYIVTWQKTPAILTKLVRNYVFSLTMVGLPVLLPLIDFHTWMHYGLMGLSGALSITALTLFLEKKELRTKIELQREAAQEDLEQLNARYNSALLIQEIGQAASTTTRIGPLLSAVVRAMEKGLDFDRGAILLANEDNSRLVYRCGFGYNREQEKLLADAVFHLDRPDSKGYFVRAFKDRQPFLLDDALNHPDALSERSRRLAEKLDVKSLLCVPILYENESLGILAVDNVASKRSLTQSDMNLLMGVASQMAISIVNARSFQRLKQSEEKYRSILDSIEDAYFEVDLRGNFTFFNDSTCRIIGYTRNELAGLNYRQVMDAETAENVYRTFRTVYEKDEATSAQDWQLRKKDGEACFVQSLVSMIKNTENQPIGFRGIARDLTERIVAEKEKKYLEARLRQAEKMEAIGTLAGGVAHDLNNVLSGLVSYPELILMDLSEDSPLVKPISTIKRSGERASAIVQDLLTLARRGVAVSEVVNLNRIVEEYLRSPEHEGLLGACPGVSVRSALAPDLLNNLGSPVHLMKSLMNIMANAAEAMSGGGLISIATENRYLDRPVRGYDSISEGEYVVLKVADTGIGISNDDIERIFEPFYTKKVMGRSGSGLGMAVVWGTVKDHKGYIDVKSTPGKGTTFNLYLPVTRKPLNREDAEIHLDACKGAGESILVVDDVPEQRHIATQILTKLGYSVASVPSGESALTYLGLRKADLLVLDMIMEPGMDGLDTYRRVLQRNPTQKAIIASGFSESERVREAQRLGAGAYVKKPYTARAIALAVKNELHPTRKHRIPSPGPSSG